MSSDHEWSCVIGIGEGEDAALFPGEKVGKHPDVYPWRSAWPPPDHIGNFASEELRPLLAEGKYDFIKNVITGYHDGFATAAQVGSYPANALGLYDLHGNVHEWCEDWSDSTQEKRVYRGAGSWADFYRQSLSSSWRGAMGPSGKVNGTGFRVVMAGTDASR